MRPTKWQTFEHKGKTLIAVPKLPGEESHQACRRCIRNTNKGFGCTELPACAGLYFRFLDGLTEEETVRLTLHRLGDST